MLQAGNNLEDYHAISKTWIYGNRHVLPLSMPGVSTFLRRCCFLHKSNWLLSNGLASFKGEYTTPGTGLWLRPSYMPYRRLLSVFIYAEVSGQRNDGWRGKIINFKRRGVLDMKDINLFSGEKRWLKETFIAIRMFLMENVFLRKSKNL